MRSKPSRAPARATSAPVPRGFDAVDVAGLQRLEEQVVEDEAQVGLAGAVIGQAEAAARLRCHALLQQRFDELEQVVDLLQLAPAVLVELAVARQDVQFLEQLDRLAGPDHPSAD
jgi:hypothetical protein